MDYQWFKIRSWHIYSGVVSRGNRPRARCGRWAVEEGTVTDRPNGEKSCEACLRAVVKD